MPNNDVFVDSRACWEFATYFGSLWVRSSVKYAVSRGYNSFDIGVNSETPEKFSEPQVYASAGLVHKYVSMFDPKHFYGFGHGNERTLAGDLNEIIYEVGSTYNAELTGKIVNFLSCLTAVRLGPDLVNNFNVSAYTGYNDIYGWVDIEPPTEGEEGIKLCRFHWVWMDWTSMLENLILRGYSVSEAVEKAKARSIAWEHVLESNSFPEVNPGYILTLNQADRDALTLIGNGEDFITPPNAETEHPLDVFPLGLAGVYCQFEGAVSIDIPIFAVCHVDDCDLRGVPIKIYDQDGILRYSGEIENYQEGINWVIAHLEIPEGVIVPGVPTIWTIVFEGDGGLHPRKTNPLMFNPMSYTEIAVTLKGEDDVPIEDAAVVLEECEMFSAAWATTDINGKCNVTIISYPDGIFADLGWYGVFSGSRRDANCWDYLWCYGHTCAEFYLRAKHIHDINLRLPKLPSGEVPGRCDHHYVLIGHAFDSSAKPIVNARVVLLGDRTPLPECPGGCPPSSPEWETLAETVTGPNGEWWFIFSEEEWYQLMGYDTEKPVNYITVDFPDLLGYDYEEHHYVGIHGIPSNLGRMTTWEYDRETKTWSPLSPQVIYGGVGHIPCGRVVRLQIKAEDENGNPINLKDKCKIFSYTYPYVPPPDDDPYYPVRPFYMYNREVNANSTVYMPTGPNEVTVPYTDTEGSYVLKEFKSDFPLYYISKERVLFSQLDDETITAVYIVKPGKLSVRAFADGQEIIYPDQPTTVQVELSIVDEKGNPVDLPYPHTPLTVTLAEGTYTITARYGEQEQTETVTVIQGQITEVTFNFVLEAPPPPPYQLTLSSDRKGTVDVGTPITFTGRLTNTETEEGVAGATIQLVVRGVVICETVTDIDGNYSVTWIAEVLDVPAVFYRIKAFAPDYGVASDETVTLLVYNFVDLTVEVVDSETLEPIAESRVEITGKTTGFTSSVLTGTESSGYTHAVFKQIPQDEYVIKVSKSGYKTATLEAEITEDTSLRVKLEKIVTAEEFPWWLLLLGLAGLVAAKKMKGG